MGWWPWLIPADHMTLESPGGTAQRLLMIIVLVVGFIGFIEPTTCLLYPCEEASNRLHSVKQRLRGSREWHQVHSKWGWIAAMDYSELLQSLLSTGITADNCANCLAKKVVGARRCSLA